MKKSLMLVGLAAVLLLFAVGCANPGGSASFDCIGTWRWTVLGDTETITINTSACTVVDTGTYNGTFSATVSTIDAEAKHFKLTTTSATGDFAVMPNGTVFFITYSVTGNILYLGMSNSAYPASATIGPYTRL